ncbi:MAG: glycosyltransferase [Anderseniella sp.]|nr:glycosyltransferase [Anderseniella sp.]
MRIVFYGSEHTAPARRMCQWAHEAGHEVMWAGYLGDVIGGSPARHVQIKSNDNPLPELEAIVSDFRPHLAHAFNFSFLTGFHFLTRACPLISSVFGGLNALVSSPHALPGVTDEIMKQSAAVIVESQLLAEAARQKFPGAAIELICLGINPDHHKKVSPAQRRDWRAALDIPQDATVFLSARGIGDGYRQPEILNAFAKALPQLPPRSRLAMVELTRGWDRRERVAELKELAARLGVADCICWLPELRHVMMPGVYGVSDFVINYPVADAFPSSVMEAVACELPVISADLPAYKGSYIARYCQLVAPDDDNELAEAMIAAAAEPAAERNRRTAAGRAHLVERFNEAHQRTKLLTLYNQISGAS